MTDQRRAYQGTVRLHDPKLHKKGKTMTTRMAGTGLPRFTITTPAPRPIIEHPFVGWCTSAGNERERPMTSDELAIHRALIAKGIANAKRKRGWLLREHATGRALSIDFLSDELAAEFAFGDRTEPVDNRGRDLEGKYPHQRHKAA